MSRFGHRRRTLDVTRTFHTVGPALPAPELAGSRHVGTAGRTLARRQLMNAHPVETEALLTPSEVATLFRVDPKTATRWAKAGKLSSIRTLGGHRRYRESEVRDLLNGVPQQRPSDG